MFEPSAIGLVDGRGIEHLPTGVTIDWTVVGPASRCTFTLQFGRRDGHCGSVGEDYGRERPGSAGDCLSEDEGTFIFPLSPTACVCGYAVGLDVDHMKEAVLATKPVSRSVFDEEIRRGGNVSFMEAHDQSNVFTTRVPDLGNGKVIRVSFVDTISQKGFLVPISFGSRIRNDVMYFSFHLTVFCGQVTTLSFPPAITHHGASSTSDRYEIQETFTCVNLSQLCGEIKLNLQYPNIVAEVGKNGSLFFIASVDPLCLASCTLPPLELGDKTVLLLWDTSSSHSGPEAEKEAAVLSRILAHILERTSVTLYFFDINLRPPVLYDCGASATSIMQLIAKVQPAGGTDFRFLFNSELQSQKARFSLLFTDGIQSVPAVLPDRPSFSFPLHAFSAKPSANFSFLHKITSTNGGTCFNISGANTFELEELAGRTCTLSLSVGPPHRVQIYPKSQTVTSPLLFTGKISSWIPQIREVTVTTTCCSQVLNSITFVNQSPERGPPIISLLYGSQKIDFHSSNCSSNHLMQTIAHKYGVMRAGLSFLVLDTLEQYVKHNLVPPSSLPELRAQYHLLVMKQEALKTHIQEKKVDIIGDWWQSYVTWWEGFYSSGGYLMHEMAAAKLDERFSPCKMTVDAPFKPFVPTMESHLSVRQLRIREDTSKYLLNMDPTTAYYDPKTRHMRPSTEVSPEGNNSTTIPVSPPHRKRSGRSLSAERPAENDLETLKTPKRPRVRLLPVTPISYTYQLPLCGFSPHAIVVEACDIFETGNTERAYLHLSTILECNCESPSYLWMTTFVLLHWGMTARAIEVCERLCDLAISDPSALLLLCVALSYNSPLAQVLANMDKSVLLLQRIVNTVWDTVYNQVEIAAVTEFSRAHSLLSLTSEVPKVFSVSRAIACPLLLELDIRVAIFFDIEWDMELVIVEPSGELCCSMRNITSSGGLMSREIKAHGPIVYSIKQAQPGEYRAIVRFFGCRQPNSPVTVFGVATTHFGNRTKESTRFVLSVLEPDQCSPPAPFITIHWPLEISE